MSGYARIPYRVCAQPGCVQTFLIGHRGSASYSEHYCPEHREAAADSDEHDSVPEQEETT